MFKTKTLKKLVLVFCLFFDQRQAQLFIITDLADLIANHRSDNNRKTISKEASLSDIPTEEQSSSGEDALNFPLPSTDEFCEITAHSSSAQLV